MTIGGVDPTLCSCALFKAFANVSGVLGYELINEPYAQNPAKPDAPLLAPLYARLNAAIRAVDTEHIVFYESVIAKAQLGMPTTLKSGPGGLELNDRQAFSYHICQDRSRLRSPPPSPHRTPRPTQTHRPPPHHNPPPPTTTRTTTTTTRARALIFTQRPHWT